MDYLERFSIPLNSGKNIGIYEYQFDIDKEFFNNFEESLIDEGLYDVRLNADIKERMIILDFEISGTFSSNCDRCLAKIDIPSLIDYRIYLKYGSVKTGFSEKDIDDIIYIEEGEPRYNISGIIHQLIMLSLPLSRTYDCENDPNPKCDFEMLDYLNAEKQKEQEEIEKVNPVWEQLKNDFNNY